MCVWRVAGFISSLVLIPHLAMSQQPLVPRTLDSGTVVRLHVESGDRTVGKLLVPFGLDSTRLRFCQYPAPPCTPGGTRYGEYLSEQIRRLEIHRGTAAKRYAIIGAIVGLPLGILGRALAESNAEQDLPLTQNVAILVTPSAILALVGALVGGNVHSWGSP